VTAETNRQVRLRVRRARGWADYTVTVPDRAYLLDALEAAAAQDPGLLFRHACHHASCGTCGLRVNGRERLACVTPLDEVARGGRPVRLEPLRHLPKIADLLVDPRPLFERLAQVELPPVRAVEQDGQAEEWDEGQFSRFEDCIECGLCVSACPVSGTDPLYWGPAALAAAARLVDEPRGRDPAPVLAAVDDEHGLWRCHGVFECTRVCPTGVDPGRLILALRGRLLGGG
jgi:succinate dehydrogenase / fumarate reductase iron-sulfur subunit